MRELRRTVLSRPLLGLMVVLAALNCFLLAVDQRKTGFPASDYSRVYVEEITARQVESPEQALEKLDALQEEDRKLNTLISYRQTKDERIRDILREQCAALWGPEFEILPLDVEDDFFLRVEVRRQIRAQVEYLLEYPSYLKTVHSNAKTMASLSFFQNEDGFTQDNIRHTDEDYPQSAELQLDRDMALESLLSTRVPGWSMVIYMAALALSFVAERKRGLWALLYGTAGGRSRLALRRVLVLLAGAAFGTVVIFGSCLLTASFLYGGLGDLSRNVQSMSAFRGLPELMAVGTFLLLDLLWRVLGAWLLGLILWAALQAIANLQIAMLFAGIFLASAFAAFTLIPDSFTIVIFRYINPFALVEVPRVFLRYLNINVFGNAVRGSYLTAFLMPPFLGLSIAACVLLQARKHPVGSCLLRIPRFLALRQLCLRALGRMGLLRLELHKLLIQQRGLLVLLAFCLWLGVWLEAPSVDMELYDTRTAVYEIRLEGVITKETKAALAEIIDATSDDEAVAALERLSERVDESLDHSDGRWLVNPVPWAALLNHSKSSEQRMDGLMLLLFLIMAMSGIFAYENQSGMNYLHRGDRRLLRIKLGLVALSVFCLWLLYSLCQICLITKTFAPFSGLRAPAFSLPCFSELPHWLPLWVVGLGCLLLRLLAMLTAASIVQLISIYAKSQNQALLSSSAVLLIPAALSSVGIEIFTFLTPLDLLSPLCWTMPLWPIWIGLAITATILTVRRWRKKI